MTTGMWAWIDGHVAEASRATIPSDDAGFLGGHGVFDTMRLVGSTPFALTRHLARLRRSAAIAHVDVPWSDAELRAACEVLVAEAPVMPTDHVVRLRITVSARATSPVLHLAHRPAWAATTSAVVVDRPIDARDPLRGAKTVNRLPETLALAEAHRRGADEALRFDHLGHLSEGSASNVFLVLDGDIVTPSTATGCLPGVTRDLLLELVAVEERDDLTAADLARADEVFLTSATRGVHAVERLDDRTLTAPGPVTASVAARWADLLARTLDP
jgi:branched-chain amino acid aminotransferase